MPKESRQVTSSSQTWHAQESTAAVAALSTDAGAGLSPDEARARLSRFGPNSLPRTRQRSLIAIFVAQFKSPLIYLLFGAAGIAFALGHVGDAIVIFVVVVLNAVIGTFQEGRAERALETLRRSAVREARLMRGGAQRSVEASEIVPGDVLLLEAGDAVAADSRLLEASALQVAEAALTGESVPVDKDLAVLAEDTSLADRRNMVYAGTHVTAGRARAVVVATGASTEIGRIATLAEEAEQPETPLEHRIAQFGHYIMLASGAMFALVLGIGFLRDLPMGQILMVGISQVVGMVPEGLPVAMTIALAVGVQAMARRKAVVRRLAAVETLGATQVICSDKTGTLTRNEMTVTAIWLPGQRKLSVTGAGYEPVGKFLEADRELNVEDDAELRALLEAVVLCNDAQLQKPDGDAETWKALGDPTEVALIVVARKAGIVARELRERLPRRAEIPFDPTEKMMAIQHETAQGSRVVLKGAPEAILELCRAERRKGRDEALDDASQNAVREAAERMASDALRVLAVAVVEGIELDAHEGFAPFRAHATLLGLVGQLDPPRAEAKVAVEQCRAAGIRPVMVTGDHKSTGYSIARSLGIARDGDGAVDGRELEKMSDEELDRRIEQIAVFARVHPAQKLRIVEAFQKKRKVVAMTGDGVNDAPALVKADVGVAMGLSGTDVAKSSAEIVIADDNFATIVAAVEEGRVVYRNLKKLVLYLFSTSVAEVSILLIALILGYPPPLAAVQILWINLVTETSITVNLVMEPPEGDEMKRPPIPREEPLLTRLLLSRMAFMTTSITVSALGWFFHRQALGVPFAQVQTETFTVVAVCCWFNVLNCRSEYHSAFDLSLFKNHWLIGGLILGNLLQAAVVFLPSLNRIFHTVPFGLEQVMTIGMTGSLVLWVEETRKFFVRRRMRRA